MPPLLHSKVGNLNARGGFVRLAAVGLILFYWQLRAKHRNLLKFRLCGADFAAPLYVFRTFAMGFHHQGQ